MVVPYEREVEVGTFACKTGIVCRQREVNPGRR